MSEAGVLEPQDQEYFRVATELETGVNDQIKLAKIMDRKASMWDGNEYIDVLDRYFDPFTDANDCEALIKHLNGLGWDINVWFSGNAQAHRSNVACRVRSRFRDGSKERYDIACDDWKQGVCELALKVLDCNVMEARE